MPISKRVGKSADAKRAGYRSRDHVGVLGLQARMPAEMALAANFGIHHFAVRRVLVSASRMAEFDATIVGCNTVRMGPDWQERYD